MIKLRIYVEVLWSTTQLLVLFEQYKYWLIFPIAIFEGPIVTVIAGFLVYLGFLNGYAAYVILVFADILGDYLHYALGKYAGKTTWFKKFGGWFGYHEENEKKVEDHFKKHKVTTLLFSKISHGIGGFVQIIAGMINFSLPEFLWLSVVGTIPKTLVLLVLGFYLGSSYVKIDNYFDYAALISVTVVILGVLYFVSLNIGKKATEDED